MIKPSRRRFLQTTTLSGLALATSSKWPALAQSATIIGERLTDQVDIFIGTGGHGHTYPGATVPFGMVQLSPDTGTSGWDHCSGYHLDDPTIMGFSHTHLSGTGAADLLDILLMPGTGTPHPDPGPENDPGSGYRSRFSHADEIATPGYYSVLLKDSNIKAELTATNRVGLHRYTFPEDATGHFVIDLQHGVDDDNLQGERTNILTSEIEIVGNDTVSGGRRTKEWAPGRYIYFAMKFSKPFNKAVIVSGANTLDPSVKTATGDNIRCILDMGDSNDADVVHVKVGISAVSVQGALANLDAEVPAWDFEGVRRAASEAWENELQKIAITTTNQTNKKIFYTALYHSLVAPTVMSDVDGQYRGSDLAVHALPTGTQNYTTFSLWDTYRALHPLYTLIQTKRLPDIVNALIRMAAEGPAGVPVWPLQAVETACMIGYHSSSVVAEAYVKGIPGIDYKAAYKYWRKRAMDDDYRGLGNYRKLGYDAADLDDESASKTLEYAYDDWAVAHLAKAAGEMADYKLLLKRSRNYKNVFDKQSTFVRPRLSTGGWAEPFDPKGMGHSKKWRDYTESNSWQATFLNQHDVYEYMDLFGGQSQFLAKLDHLFNQSSELPADAPPDIAGMVGQYAHGNEPGHHVAYLYAYAGAHHKTQSRVRMLCNTMYTALPDGLAGNEDCGQMSAWYVLSSLGFYAVDPVSGNYVFGSPLFDFATVDLGNGHKLMLEAINNSADNIYIQSVTFNGKPYTKSWFRHADIIDGGKFIFHMGSKPNEHFGAKPADRPPSFVPQHELA
ncbi:GH92 family glycosyl hydrolase [Granulicella arctica]|uniref:Putative alpha-1,2-mannosidase n=1 Tax=Granulicella arctica TaxID=940613 RepID=A0A7Y9TM22_9BACT|nr:GH92 family glycosyl hydrolase [Granulicella arctica]NYF80712.1 putative alpha-1,2-mannosidase [Granulicella arctica]